MDTIFTKLVDRINSALKSTTNTQQQLSPPTAAAAPTGGDLLSDFEAGTELLDDTQQQNKHHHHHHQQQSSSTSTAPAPATPTTSLLEFPPRVLVLRSCTSRGRKILFDSHHVTDDGEYTRQTDAKFLKEVVAEFAFGSVSINTNHTNRFTTICDDQRQHQLIVWANAFPTTTTTTTTSQIGNTSSTSEETSPSSWSSSSSSSGYYSSLPLLHSTTPTTPTTTHSNNNKTTLSLPESYNKRPPQRTYLSCVIILSTSPPPTPSSLLRLLASPLDSSLCTLKHLTLSTYSRRLINTFPVTLKAFANSLHTDLRNYFSHTHIKSINSCSASSFVYAHPLLPQLISLLLANPTAHLVIPTKSVHYNKLETFFALANAVQALASRNKTLKQQQSSGRRLSHQDSGLSSGCCSNSSSSELQLHRKLSHNNNNNNNSLSSISSTSDTPEDDDVTNNTDNKLTVTSSSSFYLGDEDEDQDNSKTSEFALGDVDLNKLYSHQTVTTVTSPPPPPFAPIIVNVPLNLPTTTTNNTKTDMTSPLPHYYVNVSRRYVPFCRYQIILTPHPHLLTTYDTSHTNTTTPIIQLVVPDTTQQQHQSTITTFNCADSGSGNTEALIRTLLEKTNRLTQLTGDNDTPLLFLTTNLTHHLINNSSS